MTTPTLYERWLALRASTDRPPRNKDAAEQLGVTEAELVQAMVGHGAVRLRPDWKTLFEGLKPAGKVMALTRNAHCVHERKGTYLDAKVGKGPHGIVLGPDIDLRLFPRTWGAAFAVDVPNPRGTLRAIQIFDVHGEATHKIYRMADTDVAAWDALEAELATDDLDPFEPVPVEAKAPRTGPEDADAFLSDWSELQDTHDFFGMLRRHDVDRHRALELAEGRFARRTAADAITALLEAAADDGLSIMVFVANRGCIQIHTGPVKRIAPRGPWINVLDPDFNLHLRTDRIASSWVVDKPTEDGQVTSLELYDADQNLIAQLFGARKPGIPEQPRWRELLAALPDAPRGDEVAAK